MQQADLTPNTLASFWIEAGAKKAEQAAWRIVLLGIMGGVFIGLGAHGYIMMKMLDVPLLGNFLGASIFPVGIILVVFAGAELFTGSVLAIMPALSRRVSFRRVGVYWLLVYVGNLIGALLLVWVMLGTGFYEEGALMHKAIAVAEGKSNLSLQAAFTRGLLCNILVAGSVYMQAASKSSAGKVLLLWFPVMLFVFSGYEHSVANMFLIPLGMALGAPISIGDVLVNNFIPVTLGNLVGGAGIIGGVYWRTYVRKA